MAVYCMSDIHGDFNRYQEMLKLIEFSAEDILYILGDVIDRGKHGVSILLDMIERPNVFMLCGNHEDMCLRAFEHQFGSVDLWRQNGGSATRRELLYKRDGSERSRILRYLRALPDSLDVEVNGRAFHLVHAWPSDSHDDRIWTRPTLPEMLIDVPVPGKMTVVGHTAMWDYFECSEEEPCTILFGKGVIGIDCGCGSGVKGSRLACLRLDDFAEFYV